MNVWSTRHAAAGGSVQPRCAAARRVAAALALALAPAASGCGDNVLPDGPPIAQSDNLIVVAHLDDDMIFMQPELYTAIGSSPLTTVYMFSGDPVKGDQRAETVFEAAMTAYSAVSGSSDWDCGYLTVADAPVHHCRLHDRPISLIGLNLADGGLAGEYPESALHLVEGVDPSIEIFGPIRGRATVDSITSTVAEILVATAPEQIHTLDLSAGHGRDHSSHLFAASFAFWAAARIGYQGSIRWHRGYSVDGAPETLSAADYALVKPMVGYFEACYFGCGPCGTSCAKLDPAHDNYLRRQYWADRSRTAEGRLALGSERCVSASADGAAVVADCAGAASVRLGSDGHLAIGDHCLATGPGNDDPVVLEPCQNTIEQYWVIDGEGMVMNGRPPVPGPSMDYRHVRCLATPAAVGEQPSPALLAPLCGQWLKPHWQLLPAAAGP